MLFDKNGGILESSFYPSIIKSAARLTYTQVKRIIVDEDKKAVEAYPALAPMLLEMKELALILMTNAQEQGKHRL